MHFLKKIFLKRNKNELNISVEGCVKCSARYFEYDNYFDEYICEKCGWTVKQRPSGKVHIKEAPTRKVVRCTECGAHAVLSPDKPGVGSTLCKNCLKIKDLLCDSCGEGVRLSGEREKWAQRLCNECYWAEKKRRAPKCSRCGSTSLKENQGRRIAGTTCLSCGHVTVIVYEDD